MLIIGKIRLIICIKCYNIIVRGDDMQLRNTKIFMENLKEDNKLDSYAVMVYKNGEKQLISSEKCK